MCVFSSHISIMINVSPTEEIDISRGLRQGDPLAPFLFLVVAEGLSGLMHKALDTGNFKGFHVGDDIHFPFLQYVDDTIFQGEATWENLWSLKAILRGFELASGLKVNFSKGNLFGINVDNRFMGIASTFLHCYLGSFSFQVPWVTDSCKSNKLSVILRIRL